MLKTCRSKSSALRQVTQCGHKVRTKRCAIKPIKELANKNGSIPISFKRGTAPIAVLVCSVEVPSDLSVMPVPQFQLSQGHGSPHHYHIRVLTQHGFQGTGKRSYPLWY